MDFNSLGAVGKARRNVLEGPRVRKKPTPRPSPRPQQAARLTTAARIGNLAGVPNTESDARGRLVLASGSPRRSQILGEAGVHFRVDVSGIDEQTRPNESPEELVV
ncbi:MAG: hypothetical protein CL931_15165, partial [Deltaproteobacteria bacterium]|nr:hypothetical protein [Deltaproteobacteria bacterium]